jgi:hypothetical protein
MYATASRGIEPVSEDRQRHFFAVWIYGRRDRDGLLHNRARHIRRALGLSAYRN